MDIASVFVGKKHQSAGGQQLPRREIVTRFRAISLHRGNPLPRPRNGRERISCSSVEGRRCSTCLPPSAVTRRWPRADRRKHRGNTDRAPRQQFRKNKRAEPSHSTLVRRERRAVDPVWLGGPRIYTCWHLNSCPLGRGGMFLPAAFFPGSSVKASRRYSNKNSDASYLGWTLGRSFTRRRSRCEDKREKIS